MLAVVDILTIALAVILSSAIVVILLYTGLHRTILCGVGGIGVTAMIWRSFPPAATLPTVVEVLFCLFISLVIYWWPEQMSFSNRSDASAPHEGISDHFTKE
jgi:hypothetical protein